MKKTLSGFIIVLILTSLLVSCAINPVTGKRELMLLSETDEIAMGRQTDPQIVEMYGVYDDENLKSYINDLGQQMVKISHRPNLNFEFKVMDSPVINAFAVPGGYVYITRGILGYLNNEAELAGVIGHEIGHVTARHSAQQYSKAQLAQIGIGLGSMMSETFARYAGLAQSGVGLLFLKFSRDHERESDDLGVEYSTKVGYDAREMSNFFHTLDKMQRTSQPGGLPDWFSTHPNPADRVVDVKKEAEKMQKKFPNKKWKVNRNEFLSKIHKIIYGPDPRQGYVDNNVFYHPELKFQFPKPAGWQLNNQPTQVQIFPEDQKAAIIFSLASGTNPEQAATDFVTKNNAVVVSRKNLNVHGFSAHEIISKITAENGITQILSYYISKDQNLYYFHGFSAEADFANYQSLFMQTMNGFNRLTDQSKINVNPDIILVKKVTQTGTLESALKSLGNKTEDLQEAALLNGMELNQSVPANTWIKTIARGK